MMYRCDNCGEIFALPVHWREHGEPFTGSPCCHDSYIEMTECSICGEPFPAYDSDECPDCLRFAFDRFIELLDTFTADELRMIEGAVAGEDLTKPRKIRFPLE